MKSRITFTVDQEQVATIVSLLLPEIADLRIEQLVDEKEKRRVKHVHRSKASETRLGRAVINLFVDDKVRSLNELGSMLEKGGMFTAKSVSPMLSQLVAEGLVKRVGQGQYQRA